VAGVRSRCWELAHNTIVIFMTDNGTANGVSSTGKWRGFNAGMTGKKSAYHDGGHRVPFFLRWPAGDMQGGRDIGTLAAHVDVMPTLIDICELKQSTATFDGKSARLACRVGSSVGREKHSAATYYASVELIAD
jgi:arylsulfatase A-like enzyme